MIPEEFVEGKGRAFLATGTAYEKALRQEGVFWEQSHQHDWKGTGSQRGLG